MSLRGYSFNDGRPTSCHPVGIGPGSKVTPVWTRELPGHPTRSRDGGSLRALYGHSRQSRKNVSCSDTRYNVLLVYQRWRRTATPSWSNRRVGWGGGMVRSGETLPEPDALLVDKGGNQTFAPATQSLELLAKAETPDSGGPKWGRGQLDRGLWFLLNEHRRGTAQGQNTCTMEIWGSA